MTKDVLGMTKAALGMTNWVLLECIRRFCMEGKNRSSQEITAQHYLYPGFPK